MVASLEPPAIHVGVGRSLRGGEPDLVEPALEGGSSDPLFQVRRAV
jgi:hypothetical protein